jgi:hypothetical protein
VGWEVDVLPGRALGAAGEAAVHGEPARGAEVLVAGDAVGRFEHVGADVGQREVGDGVAAGLEEQRDPFAGRDPPAAELDAHPPAQRLGVGESRWGRSREEAAGRVAAQRALLP